MASDEDLASAYESIRVKEEKLAELREQNRWLRAAWESAAERVVELEARLEEVRCKLERVNEALGGGGR